MRSAQGPAHPYSRLSRLRFLKGDHPGAIAEMRRAVETGIVGNQPKENVAWAQFMLGALLFQTGDLGAEAPSTVRRGAAGSAGHGATGLLLTLASLGRSLGVGLVR